MTILFQIKVAFHSLIEVLFRQQKQSKSFRTVSEAQFVFSVFPLCILRTTDGWGWHTLKQLDPQLSSGSQVWALPFSTLSFLTQISSAEVLSALQTAFVANSELFATNNVIAKFSFSPSERAVYTRCQCLQMDSITQVFVFIPLFLWFLTYSLPVIMAETEFHVRIGKLSICPLLQPCIACHSTFM